LGQLVQKDWNGLQTVNYKYNPRGWLTHINDPNLSQSGDTFGMQIFYDFGYGSVNYNGNISGIQWKSSRDGLKRSFGYSYDQLNRISQGHYVRFGTSWNQESGRYSLSGITYDRNGNIKTLNRMGKTSNPGSFGTIDQLTYSYAFNRVTKIEDGINSSFGFDDFKNGANVTTEYEYNDAGSIKRDRNKGITSITYNFNNLPRVIQFGSSSNQITNVYDSEGRKLSTTIVSGGVTKTYDYLGEFVYLNNAIQHFAHEEGRTAWDGGMGDPYDEYFYKDHLGNVRQVIRAPFTQAFRATMEEKNAQEEEQLFDQLPETRILDHKHNNTPGGNQVAWLNADRGRLLGPSRTQEVQEGDSLTLEVDVIFDRKPKGLLHPSALIRSGSETLWKDRLLEGVQNLNFSPEINPFLIYEFTRLLLAEIESKKTPESYLMYALYDQDSVLYDQGKVLVSNAAANEHEQLLQTLKVKKNGYLETFVVNETGQNIYFDNLRVQSTSPIIVQENAYYPFGMTIAGLDYSYNNHTNKYLYNGKELQSDLNLNLYDYGARFYDPVIGRWNSVDPLADQRSWVSPYNFVQNNPLNRIDPDGRLDWIANREGEVYWDENATSQATTKTDETYLGKSGTGIDEQTGNTVVYNSDGSTTEGIRSLPEFTVSSPNPVQDGVYKARREFATAALGVTKDATGKVGVGATAAGLVVAPFVPIAGAGLIGVGETMSGISSAASGLLNLMQGNVQGVVTDMVMVGIGNQGARGLNNMLEREVIGATDEIILRATQNTSLEITGQIVIPALQKKKKK